MAVTMEWNKKCYWLLGFEASNTKTFAAIHRTVTYSKELVSLGCQCMPNLRNPVRGVR